MKKFLIVFTLLIFVTGAQCQSSEGNRIYVASWNLENLFDTVDDPDKRDEEFTAAGTKEWTDEKFENKKDSIAKVIKWMNDGNGPDLLGIQEIEHEYIMADLLEEHFPDRNYKLSYVESLDGRGIDNGLVYNADLFTYIKTTPHEVKLSDGYPTRYILQTELIYMDKDTLHVFVNHWPSRSGGQEKSEPNRIKAASVLRNVFEDLQNDYKDLNAIMIGDFNDDPTNKSIAGVLEAAELKCDGTEEVPSEIYNLSYSKFINENIGTYLYRGNWNMLDQIIVSKDMVDNEKFSYECGSFEIVKPEFLVTPSGKYKGATIPTFGGRTYLSGFSDHFPVAAKFIYK
ncbi:MAG: hypothetical protein K9J16_02865 [Melioribacteraceae bacterium]|nr:hypothetical protein [Melioribacteraceae bacterium]MCF8396369.1 hypothetical protein [Melioribacteraceae bacterium]MCF8417467.1 hypothetical protein [Melioribacteraceae bacterium]